MHQKISINMDKCNGCGNCMIACPESALNNVELMGGKGADASEMSMAITDGRAHLSNEKICKRNFSITPFESCKQCLDACPLSAIIYPENEGFTFLSDEVITRGECSGCGLCSAICPEKVIDIDELPELRGECTNCGYCVNQCPRIYLPEAELEKTLFGAYTEDLLGHCEVKIAAKSRVGSILDRSQDGGFVTSVLKYALENQIIDGAIVAGVNSETWKPIPMLATTFDEVLAGAGTKYSCSPNLALLKVAKEEGLKALAIVGLPCHIEGLRKIEGHPIEDMDIGRIVKLSIGLFCKSNFEYEGLKDFIEGKCGFPIDEVKKIAVRGRYFRVTGNHQTVKIPLEEALAHKRKGCKGCKDFTSRLSDFSVGAVGSPRGYSTVFARTKLAVEILKELEAGGLITTRALEVEKPGIKTIQSLVNRKERDAEAARTEDKIQGELLATSKE